MAILNIVGTIYSLFYIDFCYGFGKPNQMKWLGPSFLEDFIWAQSQWIASYSDFIYRRDRDQWTSLETKPSWCVIFRSESRCLGIKQSYKYYKNIWVYISEKIFTVGFL